MKTRLFTLIVVLFLFSCNNDDDAAQNSEPTLIGPWSLVNVSGGFAGIDDDFEVGLITWDFNENFLEFTVTNNNTTNVIFDGLPSGTYNFQVLSTTGEDSQLVTETFSYEITTLTSSQLVLDEGIAFDGFLLTFSR
ncbi:MAG: hypothetical protein AB8B52_08290 [Winogradskyella sp.]|uniref:hypothetical protein n=1 Tax=Winogradskyella sp. TaxID=1883156 RepID=UPI00385BC965